MPSNAKSAKSVYLLQKFFEKHFNDTKGMCYYYCVKCHRTVDGEDAHCLSGCAARVNKFLYVPVEPQLKQRLEGEFKPTKSHITQANIVGRGRGDTTQHAYLATG